MPQNQMMDEKYTMMTETPVEKLVVKLAIPTIITMLISALYNMADTYFVGTLGTSATAAVGISFSLMAIIQAFGFLFGQGAGNYIARQLGAQNYDKASRMAATGFFSAVLAGLAICVSGLFWLDPLANLLGSTPTILPHARDYLWYILIGAPFMCSSLVLNTLLRFQGSAVYGMVGMVSGAFLNVVLDPLFIFVFKMGVAGASSATMISQAVSCVILLIGCSRKGNISIHPKNFSPSLRNYKEILRGGVPSLIRQSIASVAAIFVNRFAGAYGDAAIAALSIVNRVTMFCMSALIGFGQGFQPVCGFNYGARRYDRVRRAFWFCVRTATVGLLLISVVVFIFAPQIVALFRGDDPAVISIGTLSMRLMFALLPLSGWVIMNNMMMQTMGKAFKASLLAMARQGIFMIPFLFILAPTLGLLGIQLAQPAAELATFLLSIPLGLSVLRELREGEEAGGAPPPDALPAEPVMMEDL